MSGVMSDTINETIYIYFSLSIAHLKMVNVLPMMFHKFILNDLRNSLRFLKTLTSSEYIMVKRVFKIIAISHHQALKSFDF